MIIQALAAQQGNPASRNTLEPILLICARTRAEVRACTSGPPVWNACICFTMSARPQHRSNNIKWSRIGHAAMLPCTCKNSRLLASRALPEVRAQIVTKCLRGYISVSLSLLIHTLCHR